MKRKDVQAVQLIRDYLDENLYEEHSIQEICRKFTINREKLQTGFHQLVNSTVHAYIIRQRIDRAAQRLLETEDSNLIIFSMRTPGLVGLIWEISIPKLLRIPSVDIGCFPQFTILIRNSKNEIMNRNQFVLLVSGILLCLLVNRIVYFGYTSNYSAYSFSRTGIKAAYEHDVYKYRILSRYLLFGVDDWLDHFIPGEAGARRLRFSDPQATDRFYRAIYYMNSFFLVLTVVLATFLLDLKNAFSIREIEKALLIFFIPLVIGISSYAISFYDVSSYFFQVLILYLFMRYIDRYYLRTLIGIAALIILSTLNRESSALSVSLVSLLLLVRFGVTERILISIGTLAACFLVTYIALHLLITESKTVIVFNPYIRKFFVTMNLYGLLFWVLFCYLPFSIAVSRENKKIIIIFLIFSLPYIATCLIKGVLWEVRLYIPLLLACLFLSKMEAQGNVLSCRELLHQALLFCGLQKRASTVSGEV